MLSAKCKFRLPGAGLMLLLAGVPVLAAESDFEATMVAVAQDASLGSLPGLLDLKRPGTDSDLFEGARESLVERQVSGLPDFEFNTISQVANVLDSVNGSVLEAVTELAETSELGRLTNDLTESLIGDVVDVLPLSTLDAE